MSSNGSTRLVIAIGVVALFGIITFALAAATLGTVNKHHSDLSSLINERTNTTGNRSLGAVLANSIRIQDVMLHLKQFQHLASNNTETRAIHTPGFEATLKYIEGVLSSYSDYYQVNRTNFNVKRFVLGSDPILSSYNGVNLYRNYTYSKNRSIAEFYHVRNSLGINLPATRISVIPNVGCNTNDWEEARRLANGTLVDRVVLIKRGTCTFREKGSFAANYSAKGILFYNHGLTSNDNDPIEVSLGQDNNLPALFLSYPAGQELASLGSNSVASVTVIMTINVQNNQPEAVGNICADTLTGDKTQTIVIGSHSDSVPDGPGINDNGSGSAANLGLAVALARLFRTSAYPKYKYRVRFCWWGAEEVGLLGSEDHVKRATTSNIVGDRIKDYLVNLNYDMLGSPNYIFGIYEGRTAPSGTNAQVISASSKISELFRDWFIDHDFPWDYTDFNGRSDYGPFLAAGVAAGGLFSGADELKTDEQRVRYNRMLGEGRGGRTNVTQDPCYHKLCDSTQNIDVFGYEKMVQAAAYMLEKLGQHPDLEKWLYPTGRPTLTRGMQSRHYDSVNEYFRLPYL